MNDNISDKDKKEWEDFLKSDEKIFDKDNNHQNKEFFKTKSIDLHGYTLDQANKKIEEFIQHSYSEKINKIIVVTGKGLHSQNEKNPYVSKDLSILKHSVPSFITSQVDLMSKIKNINLKDIEDSSKGSFTIYLKNKTTE